MSVSSNSRLPLFCLGLFAAFAQHGNAATPVFLARHDYVSPGSQFAIGDVNGDGFQDIVGVSNLGVQVLLGTGRGTFVTGPQSAQGYSSPYVPVLADFNNDGILDIAVAATMGSPPNPVYGVAVSLGNGDGSFQAAKLYQVGINVLSGSVVSGDFDNDGILDLVVVTQNEFGDGVAGVWLLIGNGDGTFQAPSEVLTGNIGDIVAADFNGDGALDLALCSSTGFTILLGKGNGTFQVPEVTATPRVPARIAVSDVNLDGKLDLVLVAENTTAHAYFLYLGNGNGTFSGPTFSDLPGDEEFAIGDVNNDGKPDLVNSSAYISLGNGKGQFGSPFYYPTASAPLGSGQVFLADLRNDGRLDILEGNGVYISVILNEGRGFYEDGDLMAAPVGIGCGAAADFNLDGKPDLAVANYEGVSLFLGTGSESAPFSVGPTTAVSGAVCLLAGDFNNDGIPDLLVGVDNPAPAEPTANLYLGNGAGAFALASSTPGGTGGAIALGDFNHDGNLDWVTTDNLLALGNGDGTFQTSIPLLPSCTPETCGFVSIAAADLDHDGWTDIVLTLYGGDMWVLINNRQGGFTQKAYSQGLGDSAFGIAIGDLNGDGNADIFLAFGEFDGGAIYLGNGKGGFAYKETLTMPVDFSGIPLIADINGDGIADIEIACASTTAVFLGEGGLKFATPFYLGTGPEPAGILPMDLHGQSAASGLPDLVYPDGSGLIVSLINLTK